MRRCFIKRESLRAAGVHYGAGTECGQPERCTLPCGRLCDAAERPGDRRALAHAGRQKGSAHGTGGGARQQCRVQSRQRYRLLCVLCCTHAQVAGMPAAVAAAGGDGGINDICWDDMEPAEKRLNTVAFANTASTSYMRVRWVQGPRPPAAACAPAPSQVACSPRLLTFDANLLTPQMRPAEPAQRQRAAEAVLPHADAHGAAAAVGRDGAPGRQRQQRGPGLLLTGQPGNRRAARAGASCVR